MEDIFNTMEPFNPKNEDLFRFTPKEKEKKKKNLTNIECYFMIYMIAINLFFIFYPNMIGKENFSNKQEISNMAYNSFCIIVQCLSFILFPGNKGFLRLQSIFKFFLNTKIYLDFFNLINLTPSNYGIEIFSIFYFMLFLNLILLIFYTRFHIDLDFRSVFIILGILIPLSILSSYLFRREDSYNLIQFISLEFVKIIFYFFIFLIHCKKIKNSKKKNHFTNQIKSLEDLNEFYFQGLKNSQTNGFLVVENFQNLYYNSNYFENILCQSREKMRSLAKNTNQNFSILRSQTEISSIPIIKKKLTPIRKLEPTQWTTKKQLTHIPKNTLQYSDMILNEGDNPNFQKFSTNIHKGKKKKKMSLSCKCVTNPNRRVSLNSAGNDFVQFELNTDLIRMNFDINISDRRESKIPLRKNYSSINFKKGSLDKITEEISEKDSRQDMDFDEDIRIKPRPAPTNARRSDLMKTIPKIKNFEKIQTEKKIPQRKDTYDEIISDNDYKSSSYNSSDDERDNIQSPMRNSINVRGPNHQNSNYSNISKQQTVRQNSIKLDSNIYRDEIYPQNNHTGSYDFDSSYKSHTMKEEPTLNKKGSKITSRFNPKSSSRNSKNIASSNTNNNNNYNFNIINNKSHNSSNNIHLQIVNNNNNDEGIPISVRRKDSKKKLTKFSKKSETYEEHILTNYNIPHILGSLIVEEYLKDKAIARNEIHDYISNVIYQQIGKGIPLDRFLFEFVKICKEKLNELNAYSSYEDEFGPYVIVLRDKLVPLEEQCANKMCLSFALKIVNLDHFRDSCTAKKKNIYDGSSRNLCFILFKDHFITSNLVGSNICKKTGLVSQVDTKLNVNKERQPLAEANSEIIGLKVENESEYLINSFTNSNNKDLSNVKYPLPKQSFSLRNMVDSLRKITSVKDICEIPMQEMKFQEHVTSERDSIQFKPIINNIPYSNHKYSISNTISNQRYSGSSSSSNQMLLAKISAMLHDFKHIVLDNTFFFKYLIKQYGVALKVEDMLYIKTMKKYVHFLVKNLTSFFKDQNNFLKGDSAENNKPTDIPQLLDNLIAVFNRRLQFENSKNKNEDDTLNLKLKKNIKIYHNIIDRENPNYQKLISNKNLLMSVFYNLLSNAYKETEEGEIVAETSINLLRKEILVRIIDTGRGMPETVKKNWGLPFHKYGENAGTGLGQFIIETVKNSLKLFIPRPEDNPNGRGTIISVYIPLEDTSNPGTLKLLSNSNSVITRKETFTHEINPEEKRMLQREIIWESNSRPNQSPELSQHIINYNQTKIVYNVLVFDDDSFVLRVFHEKVEKELKYSLMKWDFEFVYVKDFESFYEELYKMLRTEKKVFDFFVLDQNIALNIKGVEVAEIICKVYDAFNLFDRRFFNFIFMTEEANLIESYKSSHKNFSNSFARYFEKIFPLRGENIFGKVEMKFIKCKMIELIEKMQEHN